MATTFLNDTFTGTNGTTLTSHTGETGATWTLHPSYGNAATIEANRVFPTGSTGLYTSGTPASADYCVEGVVHARSVITANAGVCARMSTSANTMYTLRYRDGVDVQLVKIVAGTLTSLGTHAITLSAGESVTIKLSVKGSAIKGYVDGVERISVTDTDITAAGRAGVRFANAGSTTTGFHLDSIRAHDIETVALAGTANGAATAAGAVSLTKTLAGTAAGAATASGAVSLTKRLTGTAAGSSTCAGALALTKPLAGTAVCQATANGALSLTKTLQGTATGAATTTGSLSLTKTLAGTATGQATATGLLALVKTLAGTAAGAATGAGALTVLGVSIGTALAAGPGAALVADTAPLAVQLGLALLPDAVVAPKPGAALVSDSTPLPTGAGGADIQATITSTTGGGAEV